MLAPLVDMNVFIEWKVTIGKQVRLTWGVKDVPDAFKTSPGLWYYRLYDVQEYQL